MSDGDQNQALDEPFDLERETLDRQPGIGIDWGGDGSDLERPVREHILAALRPTTGPYAPPLDVLLGLGRISDEELEQRTDGLGIGQEHVPALIRMIRDRALSTAYGDDPAVYAPENAISLLERFDASEYVADLIPLFDLDFDLIPDRLGDIFAAIGDGAFAPTLAYVHDRTRWVFGRSSAATAVRKIAERNPEVRDQAIAGLSDILANAESDHEVAVTGALTALIDLDAVETLPLIRHAFEIGKIDEMVNGPWGSVLETFGMEPEPDDPLVEASRRRFDQRHNTLFPPGFLEKIEALAQQQAVQTPTAQRTGTQKRKQDKARKEKQKRKAASASRKANRKKRK